jgi:hypothetical protein
MLSHVKLQLYGWCNLDLPEKNQGLCYLHVIKRNRNFTSLAAITMVIFYVAALYFLLPSLPLTSMASPATM